jgi:uncharacterized phage protein (TIGR02220 family)
MKCPNCGVIFEPETEPQLLHIDAIIWFLNEITGKKFRTVEGNRQVIRARLRDGYTQEDLKIVISRKAAEWMGTRHEKYLRPETLFNPKKIEAYLNQPDRPNTGHAKTDDAMKLVEHFKQEEE